MDSNDDQFRSFFSARLDELFRTVRAPDGRFYSVRQASAELTRRGHPISHTYLANLRRGTGPAPRTSVVDALADLFGVDPEYFAPRTQSGVEATAALQALADPDIRRVALRLLDARLSREGAEAVLSMIDHVRRLEEAARRSPRSGPRPGDTVGDGPERKSEGS